MADATVELQTEGAPRSRKGLLVGFLLAILGAGTGYFLTSSGVLFGSSNEDETQLAPSKDVAFVPVEQMTITIGKPSDRRYLRFRAEIEVAANYEEEVRKLMPRVIDVLNTYLRSVQLDDLEAPSSLLTLRSQMRRRIDLVVGGGKIHDLLVMEFVVN